MHWGESRVVIVTNEQRVTAELECVLMAVGVQNPVVARDGALAAEAARSGVDAIFLLGTLPAEEVLRLAHVASFVCPAPRLTLVSEAPHANLHALTDLLGVKHLPWPSCAETVLHCLEPPDASSILDQGARLLVGRLGIRDAQDALRRGMLQQALKASNGSRRAAARILGVTRPAVQRMLRDEPRTSAETKARSMRPVRLRG